MRRNAIIAGLLAALCLLRATACGEDEAGRLAERGRAQAERVRTEAERVRAEAERARRRAGELRKEALRISEELSRRVVEVLEDIRQAVPEASLPRPRTEGRTEAGAVDEYLTEVLDSVDRYWTRTLKASGLREPRVLYLWVPPGERAATGCQTVADDEAAFYCPADDTLYVSQQFASDLWNGISDTFPGERGGYGEAVGDFGLAYVVAHEYAHNVQAELGFYSLSPTRGAKPFELQADCMAGLWANSVLREGRIEPGDVEEAVSTALAAGDFDYTNAQHHGTPEERRDAWLLGYESCEPSRCGEFMPS
jgi:predicted metalloprotease